VRRIVRVIGLGLLGATLLAGPVSAGRPEQVKETVDDVFVDPVLSAACGVDVSAHVTGHAVFRLFTDADGNPVRELNNYAIDVVWSSVNGEIHAKDVGADRVTYLDDGGIVLVIIGNVQSFSAPGQGRVYADVGRVMIEFDAAGNLTVTPLGGQHDEDQLEAICGILG
jgi:hypothetical protein